MIDELIWAIPLSSLLAAIICSIISITGIGTRMAYIPALAGMALTAGLAIAASWSLAGAATARSIEGFCWISTGPFVADFGLRVDSLAGLMLAVVAPISFLVAVYSVGYMRGDGGYARYFAIFSAFVFSMVMLVLARNILMLYFFWEGVGACSYLLIGFWYSREAAAKAATKAFLVNRIADCGLLLGILLLWYAMGTTSLPVPGGLDRLNMDVIFASVNELARVNPALLDFIGWMILLGAIGKSAQFPLFVWLPDAMAGPTPVSALIHAATMVTAGVYLVARMMPLLSATPDVLMGTAVLGAITAILAAVLALFQHDLKRMLAFSTVSQLGFMFMGLGCAARHELQSIAIIVALFHLLTHAFFKALLFLAAGNVMHAMGDDIDMRHFSGLRRTLPWTHACFAIGGIALAGLPPLAGFWSKDAILGVAYAASGTNGPGGIFQSLWLIGLAGAFLTAIYISRAYFRTFWGAEKFGAMADQHPHEAGNVMLIPMMILAVGCVVAGLLLWPTNGITRYLVPEEMEHLHAHAPWWLAVIAILVSCFGTWLGWRWVARDAARLNQHPATHAKRDKFVESRDPMNFIDAVFSATFVQPLESLARLVGIAETFLHYLVESIGDVITAGGRQIRLLQNGSLALYSGSMVFGAIVLILWAVWK